MKLYQTIPLYVIRFADLQWQTERPLSVEERLAGWRQRKKWDDTPVVVNEGHQDGSLRELRASHVLTWSVRPGQQIVAVLPVKTVSEVTEDSSLTGDCCATLVSVACEPTVLGNSLVALAECSSVLGRACSLGEDGAEDAFGNDALRDHLAAYLDGDSRDTLCEVTLRELVYESEETWDATCKEWDRQCGARKVLLSKSLKAVATPE